MQASRAIMLVGLLVLGGCGRRSSLLLERQARGPLEAEPGVAAQGRWALSPAKQAQAKSGVEITVEYAAPESLAKFFSNKAVFGKEAGINPYFLEQMVFYVQIANRSAKKVYVNPAEFVLLDDLGNQYHALQVDYTTALAESKAPVGTATRGMIEDARPGYFGFGLPLGKLFPKSQRRFGLLAMSSLQAGYLYDGAVYDGMVAFWNPHRQAKRLRLILPSFKTDFKPDDLPATSLEFLFEFNATS